MFRPFQPNTMYQWLDKRLYLSSWARMAEKKTVPLHSQSVWYYMGGIALIIMLVQFITGILLMVYYIPSVDAAHATILRINSQVPFGWLIRSFHSWGANLFILALFVHMFSTYFMKAYRSPRELTWLTGLGLLGLAMGFGFTGYLLPWDEVSFFATKIGIDVAAQTPLIGEPLAQMLMGSTEVGQGTLSRFFVIHVIVLPLVSLALLGVHLLLIQFHGMSEPESRLKIPEDQREQERFFPNFVLKDLMVWLLVLNLMAVFATLWPWGLGEEADPFAPAPAGIKPEWYFLPMFQFLKILPSHIGPLEGEKVGLVLFGLVGVFLAVVPFIDSGKNRRISQLFQMLGLLLLAGFVIFGLWGFVT